MRLKLVGKDWNTKGLFVNIYRPRGSHHLWPKAKVESLFAWGLLAILCAFICHRWMINSFTKGKVILIIILVIHHIFILELPFYIEGNKYLCVNNDIENVTWCKSLLCAIASMFGYRRRKRRKSPRHGFRMD